MSQLSVLWLLQADQQPGPAATAKVASHRFCMENLGVGPACRPSSTSFNHSGTACSCIVPAPTCGRTVQQMRPFDVTRQRAATAYISKTREDTASCPFQLLSSLG